MKTHTDTTTAHFNPESRKIKTSRNNHKVIIKLKISVALEFSSIQSELNLANRNVNG